MRSRPRGRRRDRAGSRPGGRRAPGSRSRALAGEGRRLVAGAGGVLAEVVKLGRELLAIPVGLWLTAAEFAGRYVLRAWRVVLRPVLATCWRLTVASLRVAERHLTPARAVAVVGVVAIAALAVSQWLDYHSVSVGIDAYAGSVGTIAPAPEVETEVAGNAHAWVMLPLAAVSLIAVVIAVAGRRRAAVLLAAVGVAVIAISVIVDAPKGLDEGSAAIAYEDVSASLLEGFWLQLAAGAVLVACGLLLPRYLRPISAQERAARPTGPSLIDRASAWIRERARRPSSGRRRRPRIGLGRPRAKRKVQGAGT